MTDEHAMKVAKVIAKAMGDNFSDAFENKQRWTAKRGMSGGRFRDVNEPFQDDYIAAAEAAAAVIAADRAGLVAEVERLVQAWEAQHKEKVKEREEARLWFEKAQKWAEENARLREALERIATVDMGGGFLGALACQKVARAALKDTRHDADA